MQQQQQQDQEAEIYPLRERETKTLESTFGEVNETLRDVAVLSHEQGETIRSIETNAENTRVRVELGLSDMRDARINRARQSKKRACFLFTLVSVVVLSTLIGVIVWAAV